MFRRLLALIGTFFLVFVLMVSTLSDTPEEFQVEPETRVPLATIPTEKVLQTEHYVTTSTKRSKKLFQRVEFFDTNHVEITEKEIPESETTEPEKPKWNGPVLTARLGVVQGPSGKETYYNLPMKGVVNIMRKLGYTYEYWIRDDGVKMFGPYVMCAANLDLRPRGTILETSLGTAIVCDTGEFALTNQTQIDIAVDW